MDTCLICNNKVRDRLFCDIHIPKYGDVIIVDKPGMKAAIFLGSFPLFKAIRWFLKGYDIIKWWVGTDVLTLWACPPGLSLFKCVAHRIKWFWLFPCVTHWAHSKELVEELRLLPMAEGSMIHEKTWQSEHLVVNRERTRTHRLVVGYYDPNPSSSYRRWKYGLDIIIGLHFGWAVGRDVMFVPFDGDRNKLEWWLSQIDCYIRPSRHDGWPRILDIMYQNQIPFWYERNPCHSYEPEGLINFLNIAYDGMPQ